MSRNEILNGMVTTHLRTEEGLPLYLILGRGTSPALYEIRYKEPVYHRDAAGHELMEIIRSLASRTLDSSVGPTVEEIDVALSALMAIDSMIAQADRNNMLSVSKALRAEGDRLIAESAAHQYATRIIDVLNRSEDFMLARKSGLR